MKGVSKSPQEDVIFVGGGGGRGIVYRVWIYGFSSAYRIVRDKLRLDLLFVVRVSELKQI